MRANKYRMYLGYAGLMEDTARQDAPKFVEEWETYVHNDTYMQTLVTNIVTETIRVLGLLNFTAYYPSCFIW